MVCISLTYHFFILIYFLGQPCDEHGNHLPADAPPQQARHAYADPNDWTPYRNRIDFETAQFLYCQEQMSAANINTLLDLWAATLLKHNEPPPFANAADMYETIDSTPLGDISWQSFSVTYDGDVPDSAPQWMSTEYEVWFRDPRLVVRNMLDNPDYKDGFDTTPIRVFDTGDHRQYQNFMSGDWAWNEAVRFPVCCKHVSKSLIDTRIQYLRIQTRMEQCLFPLFWVATKRRFLWEQVTMNTIPFIFQLGMYITMSGGPTAVLWP